jgi:flagellin-like protein
MSTHGLGEDDAVSPIIGTVLMVAVTVILAAVVTGAFLGFKPIPKESQSAAVNVNYDPNAHQVWATYVDKGNSDYLNVTFRRAKGGESKVALASVGSKAIITEGNSNATLRGPGNIVKNFSASNTPQRGDTVSVIVEAVQNEQSTVVYTKSGNL